MKKLLVTLLLLTISVASFAQLNIQRQNAKIEVVGTLRSTYAYLCKQGNEYFLRIRSTNKFDDLYVFVLGKDAESSILTLKDLNKLTEVLEEGESVNATDDDGTEVLIVKKTMIGAPYLNFYMSGYAGSANITCKELEKAISLIEEKEGVGGKETEIEIVTSED